MAFAFKYAYPGPPFNFLGTMALSQKTAFKNYVNDNDNFDSTQRFYQIRAQVLRRTAGALEDYYSSLDTPLAPTFQKPSWQPGPSGHWVNNPKNDHIPMATVSGIKLSMQPQFEYMDESVFAMNHLRTLIERMEDEAQYASTASDSVAAALNQLDGLFQQSAYEAILVDDSGTTGYQGQPFWRVSPLDAPTAWELQQHNHSANASSPINLKLPETQVGQ